RASRSRHVQFRLPPVSTASAPRSAVWGTSSSPRGSLRRSPTISTTSSITSDPSRWVDAARGLCATRLAGCAPPELQENAAQEMAREREEAARVLYVAATRARDLLGVSALGDERFDGWL